MIKIIHRVNTIQELSKIDKNFGVEIDLRNYENRIILSHDPGENGEDFIKYVNNFRHKYLIANVKEAGIEKEILYELEKKGINNFFLLDIEFPFLLKNFEEFGQFLSLRFSKFESIETIRYFVGKVGWVWIDTYSDFQLNDEISNILKEFKICMVSPSRWQQSDKLNYYLNKLSEFNLNVEAVMIENDELT